MPRGRFGRGGKIMPYMRKPPISASRSIALKKYYKRAKKDYAALQVLSRVPKALGLPDMQKVRLRYVEVISIDPAGSGVVASYAFRANSIYDPNYTGSGHQPSGFDQIAPYYERCHVIGAKARLEYTPTNSSTSVVPAWATITCDPNLRTSTVYTSTSDWLEKVNSRKLLCGMYYNNGDYGGTYVKPFTYAYFTPKKLGMISTREYLADQDAACTYTSDISDESKMAYFNINVCDWSGGNPDAMSFTVTIDYTCVFSARLTVPQS